MCYFLLLKNDQHVWVRGCAWYDKKAKGVHKTKKVENHWPTVNAACEHKTTITHTPSVNSEKTFPSVCHQCSQSKENPFRNFVSSRSINGLNESSNLRYASWIFLFLPQTAFLVLHFSPKQLTVSAFNSQDVCQKM